MTQIRLPDALERIAHQYGFPEYLVERARNRMTWDTSVPYSSDDVDLIEFWLRSRFALLRRYYKSNPWKQTQAFFDLRDRVIASHPEAENWPCYAVYSGEDYKRLRARFDAEVNAREQELADFLVLAKKDAV